MNTRGSPSVKTGPPVQATGRFGSRVRRLVATLLMVSVILTSVYAVIVGYSATKLAQVERLPFHTTPATYNLQYREVSFFSREDRMQLQGWFIPGMRADGSLTTQRTIIMVHGYPGNRATESVRMLEIASGFVHHGFAVLTFDLRAAGKSASAPESLGYFEQRDVLGAVDFLKSGPLPYSELGRPRAIAGWGVSMGGATLLLAAAHEPAIQVVVTDCAYADIVPILQRDLPRRSHLPSLFTPGIIAAVWAIYGIDLTAVRPVDVVKNLAPRPVFFIQTDRDQTVPPSDMELLARAARAAPNAHVQTWLISGARHAESFIKMGDVYITRVVDFYNAALGPDTGATSS